MLKYITKIRVFLLFLTSVFFSQDIIVIGNSNSNNLEYISSSLSEINLDHRIWNNFEEDLLIDSLLLVNNSIILWQVYSLISDNILFTIENKINDNNSFLIFSNNLDNNDIINTLFGFTKIRDNYSESIIDIQNNNNWLFNQNSIISELGWLGSAYPKIIYSESNAFAAIQKDYDNNKTYIAGYNMDDIYNLSDYLEYLMGTMSSIYNEISIENIVGIPGDTLYIPINSSIIEDVVGFSFTIQSDPDFLYFFEMESSHMLDNFVWNINPFPFGIIEVNGAAVDGVLGAGIHELGYLKVLLYPSSTNKIALRGIENTVTFNTGESITALFNDGEIDILYDNSIIELEPPELIEPDSIGTLDINISTDHSITAIQLCLEYDSSIIGINNVEPTSVIPDNWFVTFVNHGGSNTSEIFGFGFEPISSFDEAIFKVEVESYNQNPSNTTINFCDILLAGQDSDNITSIGIGAEILIDFPDLTIIPTSIISDNNIDIIYNISNNQVITGFQYEVSFENNIDLISIITGNIFESYLGGWTFLNDNTIKIIYLNDSNINDVHNSRFLLTSSYFLSNDSNLNNLNFNISNIILTDQNYEQLSVKFEDFIFENQLSNIGDSNGDLSIDIFDIIIIVSYIIENSDLGEAQKEISDFNNDESVDIIDILLILNNILHE